MSGKPVRYGTARVEQDHGLMIYVSLTEGPVARTRSVTPNLVALDYDAGGTLMGIEIIVLAEEDS